MESLDSLSCPIEKKEVLHPHLLCINFFTLMILLALVILMGLTLSSWLELASVREKSYPVLPVHRGKTDILLSGGTSRRLTP
jgi:hypothetical protein